MARGRLITIEGLDGAGKSTLAAALADELGARGTPVAVVREPGGVQVSELLRALVTDPALPVTPRAEALLYAAARAQLVEELLEPRLRAGALLLLDRFTDSSLAYQGGARGLGLAHVRALNQFATGGLTPDLTLLLRVPAEVGLARKGGAGDGADRLEREAPEFFAAVAAAYDQLAAAEPERIRPIDARQSPREVLQEALASIEQLLARSS